MIVVERNFGGDMVKAMIRNVSPNVRVIEVNASRGKDVRAEPIVGLYEDGRVFPLNQTKVELKLLIPISN